MSDLFNEESLLEENFNPTSVLTSLCEKTKIEVSDYAEIQFPIGWECLIKEFILTVKSHPIRITQIMDKFSILDIKFEVKKVTKEVIVWRAIEVARIQSINTCANCGEPKGLRKKVSPIEMFCDFCIKNAVQLGKTHTWLDKY